MEYLIDYSYMLLIWWTKIVIVIDELIFTVSILVEQIDVEDSDMDSIL